MLFFMFIRKPICIFCKEKSKYITPLLELVNEINSLYFYCLNAEKGCKEIIKLEFLNNHDLECDFRSIKYECDETFFNKDYKIHFENCLKIKILILILILKEIFELVKK
jgi:hypothetical protein